MDKLNIKIYKTAPDAIIPSKDEDNAAYDISSTNYHSIGPGERISVNTHLIMEIPKGYFGRICPRSGLAKNYGIATMAGIIDSNFRGEICVILINHGKDVKMINPKDRIAQIVFLKYNNANFEEITDKNQFTQTLRGEKGWGSSGL